MRDAAELRALLERVRAATGPDREIDYDLAILLDKFPPDSVLRPHDRYTASIDAAVALVERVLPGWEWNVSRDGEASVISPTWDGHSGGYAWAAKIPSSALVAALLFALIAQESTP